MLSLSVIALDVSHLTDARYLAAYGVDWIGVPIDIKAGTWTNQEDIIAMMDWVEGPQWIAQVDGPLPEGINLERFDAILSSQDEQYKGLSTFRWADDKPDGIQLYNSWGAYANAVKKPENGYVLVDKLSQIKKLQESTKLGLILRGQEEQKTGIRYDEWWDEVFDLIYD